MNVLSANLIKILSFFLKILVPGTLFALLPSVIEITRNGYYWTAIVWVVIWFPALQAYIFIENDFQDYRTLMDLRHVLIDARYTTTRLIQSFDDFLKSSKEIEIEFSQLYDYFLDLRHTILRQLFFLFSNGNTNLDQHFRVSIMEPTDECCLKIVDCSNSEDQRQKSMINDYQLSEGEGTAGWAWLTMRTFIISDVDKYRKRAEHRKRKFEKTQKIEYKDNKYFICLHELQGGIKSIVSIPVIIPSGEGEKLVAIVNIDSDRRKAFGDDVIGATIIRVKAQPYIKLLALMYSILHLAARTKSLKITGSKKAKLGRVVTVKRDALAVLKRNPTK